MLGLRILFALLIAGLSLPAQEDGPPAGGGGGRRGGGQRNIREFLGLGAAPDPAAAAKGAPVYKTNCGGCHGQDGRGAQAPSLVRSEVILHDEKDETIGPVIKQGRPASGMPGFPNLSVEEIHNISQYLKMQVELAANRGTYGQSYGALRNQVTGDAKKGQAFFESNCTSCHSSTGDLSKIGAKFPQAGTMTNRILWPAPQGPQKVTVTPTGGTPVAGVVSRMDDFEISIYDASGTYHYWPRNKVKVEIEDKLEGHRALLPKYADSDIHNITAYLVTLK
jgi:cytochrome c oxidase cbb3-type subunit 3